MVKRQAFLAQMVREISWSNHMDFLHTITFKTHKKNIFKNYKERVVSLAGESI